MFMLDAISSLCTDPGLANILFIIKRFMNIIWIAGPIFAIVSGVISAIKLMTNPDEKKYKSLFRNCIMALLFLFFLPIIVNVVMGLFSNDFEIAACWKYAEKINTTGQNSGYIDSGKDKSNGILIDPGKYETSSGVTSDYTYVNSRNGVKYRLYNQTDSKWKNTQYPGGGNIGSKGSMITSIAVISSAYNNNITPLTVFNSSHRNNYPRNAIISLSSGYFNCKSGSVESHSITSALNNGQVVVIKVYGKNNGGSSLFTNYYHYMALIDIKGNDIFVGNAYSTSGYGKLGWFNASKVLTSVESADYCIPTDALLAKFK